jgi:hypothetical protein
MSYDVVICTGPIPKGDGEAWAQLRSLIEADGEKPDVFRKLHDRLTAKYPCICTLSGDDVDDKGVWSDGPLWNDFGHRAARLGIVYSRIEEVIPFVVGTAVDLGLVVFDGAIPKIYRPERDQEAMKENR